MKTTEMTNYRQRGPAFAVTILVVVEAVVFFLVALLHLGIELPVLASLGEPRIFPAAIVEGLIGLFFAVSAYAIFAHKTWAWKATIGAHAFSVAGIVLGMAALALGQGPRTAANDLYHWVMLAVAVIALLLLLAPGVKATLNGNGREK